MTDITQYDFGGRLRDDEEEKLDYADLVDLGNQKLAFIYQRLSTHEQVEKHVWSTEAQDELVDLARKDGYPDELIHVEQRDLGISGTKGREDRPGLAYLIELVEAGEVESAYVVHMSRLYRDQTLINALALGELFKEHGVIIITPQMRLNLRDRMHMRLYRMEIERAADELELMASRLIGARDLKAKAGRYSGESLPTGYIVDTRKELDSGKPNPSHHTYRIYQPHANLVKLMFRRLATGMTPIQIARSLRRQGTVFPFFPPELDRPENLKTFQHSESNDSGWLIKAGWVRSIAQNPAYIGWRIWSGEVVDREVFPPIIDEQTFWRVQEQFNTGRKIRPKKDSEPLPLSGLLYCGKHDIPKRMTYSRRGPTEESLYQCMDAGLQRSCFSITARIVDQPISEAVISQIALPGLAEEALNKLIDEYEQAKEQAASYGREIRRLEGEVENLRSNLSASVLSSEQLQWIDQQIRERLASIKELADLESQPIGAAIGQSVPGEADIELVKSFLDNLDETWPQQPSRLKNAFLRLLLDKIVIWPGPREITVRLSWRVGLEQELLIRRHCSGTRRVWTEAELDTLREHFEMAERRELMEMLPDRTWRAITMRGNQLGLSRGRFAGNPGKKAAPWYSPEEDELIRRYYAGEIGLDQALSTGRSLRSIRTRATKLGLKREITWKWLDTNVQISEGESRPTSCGGRSWRSSRGRR